MRRTMLLAAITALAMLVTASPAIAHENHTQSEPMASQANDFAAARENAPDHANKPNTFAPCIRGTATAGGEQFPCDRVDLMSWLNQENLGVTFVNDMWGWTYRGHDYVLLGTAEGVVFVDISDPKRPEVLGLLPTASTEGGFFWRDVKVYEDHVYVVSEHENHPMQVFDLTRLWGVTEYTVFDTDALYSGTEEAEMLHAHNLHINEDTGHAYIVGADSCEGGLHMVDINDPQNPTFAGCFDDYGYIHDVQCVIYNGPDAGYQGHEICFAANAVFTDFSPEGIFNALAIIDVTDKTNPTGLAQVEYADDGYSHQGWLTEDQAYFLHGDELDELFGQVGETTTRVWDVTDLENPTVIGAHGNSTPGIDHNIYVEGRWAYASNYTSGLRIFDLSAVADGELAEVAYFDTYPENDSLSFNGQWSNYAWFGQKRIVAVSDSNRGLFILRARLPGPQG